MGKAKNLLFAIAGPSPAQSDIAVTELILRLFNSGIKSILVLLLPAEYITMQRYLSFCSPIKQHTKSEFRSRQGCAEKAMNAWKSMLKSFRSAEEVYAEYGPCEKELSNDAWHNAQVQTVHCH